MAKALLAEGHTVTMVCGSYQLGQTGLDTEFHKGRREGIVDGIRVIEFDLSYSNNADLLTRTKLFLKFAFGGVGIAMSRKYDVVFATTTPLTAGLPGIAARWLRRKPFVFEVRDLWPELPRAMGVITNPIVLGAMSLVEWASYKSATRLVGLSPGICRGIAERGIPDDRIKMIPNGCDIGIFASGNREPWRPDGVDPSDFMAIFTGTHGQANGLDAVLDAAAELQRRGRGDVRLVLVGDGKLKPVLQKRAQDDGLENVIFHDPVDKSRLAGLMASADLGMQILANVPAFYYGTSPNKFFDYIAAGLPVLNNYPGWVANLVMENECGYAVDPENSSAFADALIEAADNREALTMKARNAAALARSDFDRSKLSRSWADWIVGAKSSA
ncbi:Glycosyltransferase involved in cell wall bisynthesis [Roseivivax lentus]|uniref:Glycosyltransferase involved in cell wall bisynthesis n=2 Tax=Roseivivax lentus TaxID=633194 RepID=A0A1N7PTS9_9RHOB|nr:Glycosyltransferase involved in cell wall bisynthesis [Roseivivax lentus]